MASETESLVLELLRGTTCISTISAGSLVPQIGDHEARIAKSEGKHA